MRELDQASARSYLVDRGVVGRDEPVFIEALGWGVSNVVLRVRAGGRCFVLKQSRARLRTPDAWFSRLDRVFREKEAMELLAPLLPPLVIPAIQFEDRDNFLFAMDCAPEGHVVWKEELLAGRADPAVAQLAGKTLGTIHARTASDPAVAERFRDNEAFIELRVDPFYRRIQERFPDLRREIDTMIDEMLATRLALVHADFSPKNILLHSWQWKGDSPSTAKGLSPSALTLVDFETAHHGDPAFDLGFCLSHLMLKAFKHIDRPQPFLELTRRFWRAYLERVAAVATAGPWSTADLMRRTVAHFAGCAWARLDGTSRIDYLPEEMRRTAVRSLCRAALRDPLTQWEQVLSRAEELMGQRRTEC